MSYYYTDLENDLGELENDELDLESSLGCVTRANPLVLRCFPAHGMSLTKQHRDELDRLALKIRNGDLTGKRIRTVHIDGYAAEWWGITPGRYLRRSRERALAAKRYLEAKLKGYGLSYRPKITIKGWGTANNTVDNMRHSTSAAAKRNRSLNRRIEIRTGRTKYKPSPPPPDKPVPTNWDAFLDTKLRQLREYFDTQHPFIDDTVYECVRKKILRKGVKDVVAIGIPRVGRYTPPARGGFLKTASLRALLIKDLKKGYARGDIKQFWRRFRIHVENTRDGAIAVLFRATGQDIYDRRWTSALRRLQKHSRRSRHVYSCPFFRNILNPD